MITTLVQFKFPNAITPDEAQKIFLEVAPKFLEIPGLIRKYFLLGEDNQTTGGVYLWETREDAEGFHNDDFKMWIRDRYGCQPTITYFDSSVVVDNLTNEIIHS